jgi:drug/metabolite transporter (DMT)-like permease
MSMYAYINPLVAVLLGWLILHERLTWVSIVAMCVILGGVALVQTEGRRSNRTVEIQVREESAA